MFDRTVDVPRLLASYGAAERAPHPLLDTAKSALADHYRGTAGVALGRPSASVSTGMEVTASPGTATPSAGGSARTPSSPSCRSVGPGGSCLRPRRGGSRTLSFDIGGGDLLVMGGSCQRTWQHAVPKTVRADRAPVSACSSDRSAFASR